MIRIMTSNIWADFFGNEVQVREDQLFEVYSKYQPDVLGTQEVWPNWHASTLMTNMQKAGYRILNDAPTGVINYNVIFVKDARFDVQHSGFEQLAFTDDLTKNIQWAVLVERESGVCIGVCNTHFVHRAGPRYDEVREFNAEQVAWRMGNMMEKRGCIATFAFGDMNTRPTSSVFPVYEKRGFTALAEVAPQRPTFSTYHGFPVRGEDGRFHGTVSTEPYDACTLDHIVGSKTGNYKVVDYKLITDQAALDATDHCPVYVDLEF